MQCRAGDRSVRAVLTVLDHRPSRIALETERALVRRLDGGCSLPLGAIAAAKRDTVRLAGLVASPDGARVVKAAAEAHEPERAAGLVADQLLDAAPSDPRRGPRRMSRSTLVGRTILVTRPAERARRLVKQLDRCGAHAIAAPAIELRPVRSAALTAALKDLAAGRFAWIVLTSPSTVAMLDERLAGPEDVRPAVAAIGDGTAEAFARWSGRAAGSPAARLHHRSARTVVPPRRRPRAVRAGRHRARGPGGRARAKGWTPTRVDAYRTVFPATLPAEARAALAAGEVDAVTFTSASTVRGFVGAVGAVRGSPKVVVIGPVTAKEARAHGFVVHAVADPHTTDGLIAALERVFTPRR